MWSIGFSWEYGFGYGAVPVSEGLIKPPERGVGGTGLSVGFHHKVHERITLDFGCDLWAYGIPSRIAYYEASDCTGLPPPDTWPSKITTTGWFIGRAHMAVGISLGWSHLTIAFGVRNQPHNVDKSEESHYGPRDIDARLRNATYPFATIGWEINLSQYAHITVGIYQPLNFDPVIYAPVVGISFRFNQIYDHPWFNPKKKRRPPPPEPTPPEYMPGPAPGPAPAPAPPPAPAPAPTPDTRPAPVPTSTPPTLPYTPAPPRPRPPPPRPDSRPAPRPPEPAPES
jgi:hypothetical protein